MMDWIYRPDDHYLSVALSALLVLAILIALVRLTGLRSFSKMSSFDFAITIAVGSILASALLSESASVARSAVALASLFALQALIAALRERTSWMSCVVDNQPLLLMVGEQMLDDNLRRARVAEADVWAKLREANVLDPREVRAVVLETTGDIAVLHGDVGGTPLHPDLLTGVRADARTEDADAPERYRPGAAGLRPGGGGDD